MGLYKVKHEIYGDVILNTKTQEYYIFKLNSSMWFLYNGKRELYFNNFNEFLDSNEKSCVLLVWCARVKNKKAELVDLSNNSIVFKEWETKIGDTWINNNIGVKTYGKPTIYIDSLNPYFIALVKSDYHLNDCKIKSYLKLHNNLEYKIINTKMGLT